ncbi:hypothetical protein QZH56_33145 [Streptomyces olivoreticuli]|uniref:hypothetical protein n=1 Tax=Streptomyces olivoreticuli TaxID=68246 RepID=UPI00265B1455|nr:hypothetical protein [Streptomyces olivoreticuli]WKK23508.1 hypothetical protein QZH56_33145 [Streptomyces olivoreticuli]
MTDNGGTNGSTVDFDQLMELVKNLENVKSRNLRRAMRSINMEARNQRLDVILGNATTALGQCLSGTLVLAYLWVGYQMVQRGDAGYCVLLCGMPVTSVASIFALKKVPATQAMGTLSRQITRLLRRVPAPATGTQEGNPPTGQGGDDPATP